MTKMFTSREFNQDTAGAKRAAGEGPVIITDRGEPSYVLMTYEAYRRLAEPERSLAEALKAPDDGFDFDFDPPRLFREPIEPAEFD